MNNRRYEDFVIGYHKHYVHVPRTLREAGINPYTLELPKHREPLFKNFANLADSVRRIFWG